MPEKRGNKTVITEEEAEQIMNNIKQAKNDDDSQSNQGKDKIQEQIDNTLKGNAGQQVKTIGQGSGWWNDPIRHALASYGIQTSLSSEKEAYEDYGSVYLPSDRLKNSLKEQFPELQSDNLKQILQENFLENPEQANKIDDRINMWIEENLGSIQYKAESQKERNQTINGNIQLTEEEYETLEEFHRGLNSDNKTLEMWIQHVNSQMEKDKNEAKNELENYKNELRRNAKNPEDFKMKMHQKINEKVIEINQERADLKYAKQIKSMVDAKHDEIQKLYQKSIKKSEV